MKPACRECEQFFSGFQNRLQIFPMNATRARRRPGVVLKSQ
jgi:hypothetical protein